MSSCFQALANSTWVAQGARMCQCGYTDIQLLDTMIKGRARHYDSVDMQMTQISKGVKCYVLGEHSGLKPVLHIYKY